MAGRPEENIMTEPGRALAPSIPSDKAIEQLRKLGQVHTERTTALQELRATIAGLTWGDVQGANLSKQTQHAIAEICRVTGAQPVMHLDILGGRPYFKAAFWEDLINSHDYFHHYEQRELSPAIEQVLRVRAEEFLALVPDLEDKDAAARARLRALEFREEANDIAIGRAKYSPRDTATSVVETTIWRFINATPMEAIKAGKITDLKPWLVTVTECNWAGGMGNTLSDKKKYDPVGDANPGTTARTRSLRRCAVKAFSAWMGKYQDQVEKIEGIIDAEWEVMATDDIAAMDLLPEPGGPVAVAFDNGEPVAMNPEDAEDLPIEGEEIETEIIESEPVPDKEPPKKKATKQRPADLSFDADDARKALFATLRDAGVSNDNRKAWAKTNGLPESTSKWGRAEYDKAMAILMDPVQEQVLGGCEIMDLNLADLSLKLLGKDTPQYLKDWNTLAAHIQELMDVDL